MASTPRRVLLGDPSARLPDLQRSPDTSILTRSSSAAKTVNAISSLTQSYPGCRCTFRYTWIIPPGRMWMFTFYLYRGRSCLCAVYVQSTILLPEACSTVHSSWDGDKAV